MYQNTNNLLILLGALILLVYLYSGYARKHDVI